MAAASASVSGEAGDGVLQDAVDLLDRAARGVDEAVDGVLQTQGQLVALVGREQSGVSHAGLPFG
ncbi:hypothetical protein SALBM135S_03477 [Streptomyces alboniger]